MPQVIVDDLEQVPSRTAMIWSERALVSVILPNLPREALAT